MRKPWTAAAYLMKAYYQDHNKEWPAYSASRLLREIKVHRSLYHWKKGEHVRRAINIINDMLFDVDELVECYLGIDLAFESLANLDQVAGAQVFGQAIPEQWQISIDPRTENYLPLYRSTMMHEVGHLLLHNNEHARMMNYSPDSRIRPSYEKEADLFMLVCLLPKSVLHLAIALVAQSKRINLIDTHRYANIHKGQWQWQHIFLPWLVDNLAVSRELLIYKMKSLGYFTNETVRHHKTYHMPNRWLKESDYWPLKRFMDDILKQLSY